MPELQFVTKGAADVIAQQEKLNKAAAKGADSYRDTTRAAKEAGDAIERQGRDGQRSQDRVTDSVKRTGTEYKRMTAEQRRQARTAEAIMKRNETAQERYNRLVKEARTALVGTKNASETYRREVDLLNKEMSTSTGRFSKFSQQQERTFGADAVAMIGRYAAGIGGVTIAYRLMRGAAEAANQEIERGQEFARQGQQGIGALRALAGTQEQFDQLTQLARSFVSTGASQDLDAAARSVFALSSAGLLENADTFRRLGARGVVGDTEVLSRAVATQIAAFGRQETGDADAIITKALLASEISPATLESLLQSAARGGGAGRALGLTDEEVLTATSVISKVTGSAELAGTQVRSLLASVDESGQFQGKTLDQIVQDIESRNLGAEDLAKFLGRSEAVDAFRALALNRQLYLGTLGNVQGRQDDRSVIESRLNFFDTATDASRASQVEQQRTTLRDEANAQAFSLLEAVQERERRRATERSGEGFFSRGHEAYDRFFQRAVRPFVDPVEALKDLKAQGLLLPSEQRTFEAMLEQQTRQTQVLEQMSNKLDDSGLVGVSE